MKLKISLVEQIVDEAKKKLHIELFIVKALNIFFIHFKNYVDSMCMLMGTKKHNLLWVTIPTHGVFCFCSIKIYFKVEFFFNKIKIFF